jgi:hypothetical protein
MKILIDQILFEKTKYDSFFKDSTILTTASKRKLVAKYLFEYNDLIKVSKIYRTSDGWTAAQIHAKIDNKGPTITIVKTNKNKIFGGFTTVPWD